MENGVFRGPFFEEEPEDRVAERITAEEVKARMDRGEKPFFLDVREETAWERSGTKIAGAVRMAEDDVERRLNELPRDRPIIAYCA
jgi:rhodanese-related sulfurtransferase